MGFAILMPLVGSSIRVYIDNYMIHELIATLIITLALFIIIIKSSRAVYSRQYKSINTKESNTTV